MDLMEIMVEMVLFRKRPIRTVRFVRDVDTEREFYRILKERAEIQCVDLTQLRDAELIQQKFEEFGLK